jgi:cytidylate kinase
MGRIAEALGNTYAFGDALPGAYPPAWEIPLDDIRYLEALKSVVKDLARSQSLVIRGRGSQLILGDYPGALHVLLVALLEVSANRVMQNLKLGQEAAKRETEHFDNSRREFIKSIFTLS